MSWDLISRAFFQSWSAMLLHSRNKYNISLFVGTDVFIDKIRETLAKRAKSINPDYILWLDADQVYPEDTIERLATHIDSGKSIVGGVVLHRGTGEPLVFHFLEGKVKGEDRFFRGLIKVGAMGMGGVMMSPKVFEILEEPYFELTGEYRGEDIQFFKKCQNADIDVWCDTDLIYGHIVMKQLCLKNT